MTASRHFSTCPTGVLPSGCGTAAPICWKWNMNSHQMWQNKSRRKRMGRARWHLIQMVNQEIVYGKHFTMCMIEKGTKAQSSNCNKNKKMKGIEGIGLRWLPSSGRESRSVVRQIVWRFLPGWACTTIQTKTNKSQSKNMRRHKINEWWILFQKISLKSRAKIIKYKRWQVNESKIHQTIKLSYC